VIIPGLTSPPIESIEAPEIVIISIENGNPHIDKMLTSHQISERSGERPAFFVVEWYPVGS
jgi:hypothetical protein